MRVIWSQDFLNCNLCPKCASQFAASERLYICAILLNDIDVCDLVERFCLMIDICDLVERLISF